MTHLNSDRIQFFVDDIEETLREHMAINWAKATIFTNNLHDKDIPTAELILLVTIRTLQAIRPTRYIAEIAPTMALVSHQDPIPFQTRTWTGPLYTFRDNIQAHLTSAERLRLATSLTR